MGKYADEAKQASQETDVEFKKELDQFLGTNVDKLSSLFPNPVDKAEIDALIKGIAKSTNRNETYTAIKVCASKITLEGAKMLKDSFEIAKKALA